MPIFGHHLSLPLCLYFYGKGHDLPIQLAIDLDRIGQINLNIVEDLIWVLLDPHADTLSVVRVQHIRFFC